MNLHACKDGLLYELHQKQGRIQSIRIVDTTCQYIQHLDANFPYHYYYNKGMDELLQKLWTFLPAISLQTQGYCTTQELNRGIINFKDGRARILRDSVQKKRRGGGFTYDDSRVTENEGRTIFDFSRDLKIIL